MAGRTWFDRPAGPKVVHTRRRSPLAGGNLVEASRRVRAEHELFEKADAGGGAVASTDQMLYTRSILGCRSWARSNSRTLSPPGRRGLCARSERCRIPRVRRSRAAVCAQPAGSSRWPERLISAQRVDGTSTRRSTVRATILASAGHCGVGKR